MRKGFWTADWFAGLIFTAIFFIVAYGIAPDAFQSIETAGYDLGVRSTHATPDPDIAVIAIDDRSIANLGRWPWPRDYQARMIDKLRAGGAKVIASTLLFSEPQTDPGSAYIKVLEDLYDGSALGKLAPFVAVQPEAAAGAPAPADATKTGENNTGAEEKDQAATAAPVPQPETAAAMPANEDGADTTPAEPVLPPGVKDDLLALRTNMASAQADLDTDQKLANSMKAAGNVVLPLLFTAGVPLGKPDQQLPPYLLTNALPSVPSAPDGAEPLQAIKLSPPIPVLGQAAAEIGHLGTILDSDGTVRSEPLVVQYYDTYFPSLSLAIAAQSLNLTSADIKVLPGEGVRLGRLEVRTTPNLFMYTYFYGNADGKPAFPVDSFYDVYVGNIPVQKYRNKVVLIGATALGIGDSFPTPASADTSPVVTLAHEVSSILQENFFTRPAWTIWAQIAAFFLIAMYLVLVLPRLRAGRAAIVSLALFIAIAGAQFGAMTTHFVWLPLMLPALFLISGHLFMTIKLFRVTEKIRFRSEAEGAESNKMLGLAFQGQGQLDMAFDKFRRCPMDNSIMDLLYNLALDYERKRQHNKAGAVYRYMAEYDESYRDLKDRIKRSKQMEDTVILGGGASGPGGTLILDSGDVQKPMLGRYQVEKELGKGAMGVVYLGRDPKINRIVAIKTMALSQEFEPDELEDVTARFFREAETAGRLNHPNIVTIYDAGEEHDLAYIAMEFLKGRDLTNRVKPDTLLPAPKVMDIVAHCADALAYAHGQNVVHRDIKPANIMYEAENDSVKITDFGIARITDSSKTKTGMVLGTPSYMSPEQLAGKKVDGRSDLFSLGVTLYQMLTGQLPFQADSMATLMYKIANDPHAAITVLRPDMPECLDNIINKVLQKDADLRYQSGTELAADIRACASRVTA